MRGEYGSSRGQRKAMEALAADGEDLAKRYGI